MAMSINHTTLPSCGEKTHCSLPSSIKTSYCGLATHNATDYAREKKQLLFPLEVDCMSSFFVVVYHTN